MNIAGLQKTTLLDYPGKVACTVFLQGCNFRCPFCQNGEILGGGEGDISEEEFFAFLKKRKGILDGVCVSGGEPLLQDVAPFLRAMKQKGIRVCSATTNSRFMTLAKLSVAGLADRHGCPYLSAFHSGNEFHDPEGKFSERFFPNILKRHNYDPETTMMIGDTPERDLYPAQKAGIRCCAILCRTQTQPVLFKNGGIFVRSLKILADSIAAN